jgi:hypothetical protein
MYVTVHIHGARRWAKAINQESGWLCIGLSGGAYLEIDAGCSVVPRGINAVEGHSVYEWLSQAFIIAEVLELTFGVRVDGF